MLELEVDFRNKDALTVDIYNIDRTTSSAVSIVVIYKYKFFI